MTSADLSLLLTAPVCRLLQIIEEEGGEVRIVGGAVRDFLMHRKIGDIDLATNLVPDVIEKIFVAQAIKTVPTGIAHGTLTVVIDRVGYEITTLRRDVKTDGRYAEVAYTDSWHQDAARRDFTFNALYLDRQGKITDFFRGTEDASAGHVRFIGDAAERIQEDVLRILRFFRFHAWFGVGDADIDGLKACSELAHLLPRLSAERVAREILKMLTAPDPSAAWALMVSERIIQHVVPDATDLIRLRALIACEKSSRETLPGIVRLAALLPEDEEIAKLVTSRLKLSNRDSDHLTLLTKLPALLRGHLDPIPLRRLIHAYGADIIRLAIFLTGEPISEAVKTVAEWSNPQFPLRGEDVTRLGYPAGPQIGEILRKVEDWWIASDFHPDHKACLSQIPSHT